MSFVRISVVWRVFRNTQALPFEYSFIVWIRGDICNAAAETRPTVLLTVRCKSLPSKIGLLFNAFVTRNPSPLTYTTSPESGQRTFQVLLMLLSNLLEAKQYVEATTSQFEIFLATICPTGTIHGEGKCDTGQESQSGVPEQSIPHYIAFPQLVCLAKDSYKSCTSGSSTFS